MRMHLPEPRLPAMRGGPSLSWAILAPGRIAHAFASAVRAHTDHRIVSVGSRSAERARRFATDFDIPIATDSYERAVEAPSVDAVYVAAPHTLHLPLASLAIAAGKHVLVEKPLAASADDARVIADRARRAGVFAMEAMWTRFHPWVDVADQLIADGAIGGVRTVTAEIGRRFEVDASSRLFDPSLGGGALLDMGVYTVFHALHFAGEPTSITAAGVLTKTGVDAQSTAALRFRDGRLATISSTLEAFTPSRAMIAGSQGSLRAEGRFPMPGPLAWHDADGELIAVYEDRTGLTGHGALARQAAWVAAHVREGLTESPLHPLAASVAQLEVIDEARRSIAI